MANFKDETERYFAACILDSLVYRSEAQTIALMKEAFTRQLTTHYALKERVCEPYHKLVEYFSAPPPDAVRPIAIVPVIRRSDPPTKSGPLIARMLKRHLHLDQNHLLWPWQIAEWRDKYQTSDIIFVDDLLGTGTQFKRFIEEFTLASMLDGVECVYCPLAAHEKGVERIKIKYPKLSISPVEFLPKTGNIFDAENKLFQDGINSPSVAEAFYKQLLRRIGYTSQSQGFGNLGLIYAFNHGTPNNSLPLLWWDRIGTWRPLLTR